MLTRTLRTLKTAVVMLLCIGAGPVGAAAQEPNPPPTGQTKTLLLSTPDDTRWELSVGGRVGVYPTGYYRVGENRQRGTYRPPDIAGIDFSEALDASAAFHFNERNAVRASFLYYFLEGAQHQGALTFFNGDVFTLGSLRTNADFYRVSVDYERLLSSGYGAYVWGTVGLTYVHFKLKLTQAGHSNAEDFSLQELPVPILGVRADIPLGDRWAARVSLSGGGLPRVNSLRREGGGTVDLQQTHADLGLGLVYAVTRALNVEAGYFLSYFTQYEKSHEDNNFELFDNGFRAGVTLRY